MTRAQLPDDLRDAPPGAKLVYLTLRDAERPLAVHELTARALLASSTARDSLGRLEDRGLVTTDAPVADDRETHYRLTEE